MIEIYILVLCFDDFLTFIVVNKETDLTFDHIDVENIFGEHIN